MRVPAHVQKVISGLRQRIPFLLSRKGPRPLVTGLTYQTLPLNTTLTCAGVELRRLLTPPVPVNHDDITIDMGPECERLFDIWVSPLIDGESGREEAFMEAAGRRLYDFVASGKSEGERIVRLLTALGNTQGARVIHDETSFLVTIEGRAFGIQDGIAVSRFSSGVSIRVTNVTRIMSRTRQTSTFDSGFATTYRRLEDIAPKYLPALVALRTWGEEIDFHALFNPCGVGDFTDLLMEEVRNLVKLQGPYARLSNLLVPRWMKAREFQRVVGRLDRAPRTLTVKRQAFVVEKLHNFLKTKRRTKNETNRNHGQGPQR